MNTTWFTGFRGLGAGLGVALMLTPAHADLAPEPVPVAPQPIPQTRPTRLPDGRFVGALPALGAGAELEVTIVAGRVTQAFVRRPDEPQIIELTPNDRADSVELELGGTAGSEFLRLGGGFFDPDRASGSLEGVIKRKKVHGSWTLARI